MGRESRANKIEYVEFSTTDMAATKEFYSTVFGWQFTDYGPDYASFGDERFGGGFATANQVEQGGPLVVIYSLDLAVIQDKIEQNGGSVVKATFSYPGGRRFHFSDPSGNVLAVWSE